MKTENLASQKASSPTNLSLWYYLSEIISRNIKMEVNYTYPRGMMRNKWSNISEERAWTWRSERPKFKIYDVTSLDL